MFMDQKKPKNIPYIFLEKEYETLVLSLHVYAVRILQNGSPDMNNQIVTENKN